VHIDDIADQLTSCGFVVVDDALPAALLARLDDGCTDSEAAPFVPAGTGRGKDRKRDGLTRGDVIRWLDDAKEADHLYLGLMESLRVALNERLYLGLFSYQGHYAIYGTGTHYGRHLDALAGQKNRVLSTVVYLDSEWALADGGQLVLHGQRDQPVIARILPQPGLMVMFLSEEFPHEVLAASRPRHSIAGWFSGRVSNCSAD
jgi:SM-20-related protein